MIIEFIGSTGAGKTTLITEVQGRLAGQTQVATPFELVADRLGLGEVTNPTIRNLVQDLAGLPFFIGSLYQHRAFVVFALKTLTGHQSDTFSAMNYLRSIVRKIGMHEIAKRDNHDRIILVDEGTVLSAHLLFVFTGTSHSPEEIDKFASLVPLPDLIVYVKAPVDSLVQRSLQRNDVRREMRAKKQTVVEKYVSRATAMFDRFVETKRIRDRVLIVHNPDFTDGERGAVADQIVAFILEREADGQSFHESNRRMEPASVIGEKDVN